MKVVHQLEVRLVREGQTVPGSVALFRPGSGVVPLAFDGARGLHFLGAQLAGPGILRVGPTGGGPAMQRRVHLGSKPQRLTLWVPHGTPPAHHGRFGGLLPTDLGLAGAGVSGALATLLGAEGFDVVAAAVGDPRGPFRIERQTGVLPWGDPAPFQGLRSSPLVGAVGPIVGERGPHYTFLSHQLSLAFWPDVSLNDMANVVSALPAADITEVAGGGFRLTLDPASTLDAASLGEDLENDLRVRFARPVLCGSGMPDSLSSWVGPGPQDLLWPLCWDRKLIGLDKAWAHLASQVGTVNHPPCPPKGDGRILAAVHDTEWRSVGGVMHHPSASGQVFDPQNNAYPRLGAMLDMRKQVLHHDASAKASVVHGQSCASVLLGPLGERAPAIASDMGAAGAAPGVRLGAFNVGASTASTLASLLWATGDARGYTVEAQHLVKAKVISGVLTATPPRCDVHSISLGLPGSQSVLTGSTSGDAAVAFARICRLGRAGRGSPIFMSAGNDSSATKMAHIDTLLRWAANEHVIAVGATSGPQAVRASYSNGGDALDLVAPGSTEKLPVHKPSTQQYGVGAARMLGRGECPSVAALSTQLSQAVAAGSQLVFVPAADAAKMVPNTRVLLGDPSSSSCEWPLVTSIVASTGELKLATPLWYGHAVAAPVVCGAVFVDTLLADVVAPSTLSTPVNITVRDAAKFQEGQRIYFGTAAPSSLDQFAVVGPPQAGNTTVSVTMLRSNQGTGTPIMFWEQHHSMDFGGTSAACPLAAGVGALMLSAAPRLNWRELRHILFTTADKISPSTGWTDAQGKPTTQPTGLAHHQAFGHGRVNAQAAIEAAVDFEAKLHQGVRTRDLWIRHSSTDLSGDPQTDTQDSPDIWVRNLPSFTGVVTNLLPLPFFHPSHQFPSADGPSRVWARVRNRGTEASLAYTVRWLVIVQAGAQDLRWPADFEHSWTAGQPGTIVLGETQHIGLQPGAYVDVSMLWPDSLKPALQPGQSLRLAVEISPFDADVAGDRVWLNNNLAERGVEYGSWLVVLLQGIVAAILAVLGVSVP